MNNNIDWQEVEYKISLICYRFDNLAPWHEDLAQELRIHAYYVSSDYYDLYRKAIDFWRRLNTKQFPETPYFDLEVLNVSYKDKESENQQFQETVKLIKKELNRPGNNKWDENMIELANKLLDIIVEDIDLSSKKSGIACTTNMNHYINSRLNLSWVSEETGIGYKRVVGAMKFLEDIVQGLAVMQKIEIPDCYLKNYYKKD